MNKKIITIIFILLAILAFYIVYSKIHEDKDEITFVLDWTPNTNHTGLFVADELGYFNDENIKIKFIEANDKTPEELVAENIAQFGISFQDYIIDSFIIENPLPIKAIATVINHNDSGIISKKYKGIYRPKELESKLYATWENNIELAMINNIVENDGGDFNKVELIPITYDDEVTALKENLTDALWVFYGWGGIKMELEDIEYNYFSFKDINPVFDYYTPIIISNETTLCDKNLAKRFLRAVKKGYEYSIENPEDAAKILTKNNPELDINLVLASQKYLSDKYIDDGPYFGYIEPSRWNTYYDWLYENKLINVKLKENTGFTNEFLTK